MARRIAAVERERAEATLRESERRFRATFEQAAVGIAPIRSIVLHMLAEHDAGREEVRALLRIGAGSGPLSTPERSSVLLHVNEFVPLLYGHIQKENNILYPMAQNAIAPEEFEVLDQSCEAFDREISGQLDVAGLKSLADEMLPQVFTTARLFS